MTIPQVQRRELPRCQWEVLKDVPCNQPATAVYYLETLEAYHLCESHDEAFAQKLKEKDE